MGEGSLVGDFWRTGSRVQTTDTEHVLQAKSFLGAQRTDRQVCAGQVDLTFKELVPGEEIRVWERYLAVLGDKGRCALSTPTRASSLPLHVRLVYLQATPEGRLGLLEDMH